MKLSRGHHPNESRDRNRLFRWGRSPLRGCTKYTHSVQLWCFERQLEVCVELNREECKSFTISGLVKGCGEREQRLENITLYGCPYKVQCHVKSFIHLFFDPQIHPGDEFKAKRALSIDFSTLYTGSRELVTEGRHLIALFPLALISSLR